MKFIFSIAMLLLIFFNVSMKPLLMLEWKLNQDFITAKYCENKDQPMMHCDGKCYLAKQLQKLELQEKEERSKHPFPADKLKLAEVEFLCPQLGDQVISDHQADEALLLPAEKLSFYHFNFYQNISHPPEFC